MPAIAGGIPGCAVGQYAVINTPCAGDAPVRLVVYPGATLAEQLNDPAGKGHQQFLSALLIA